MSHGLYDEDARHDGPTREMTWKERLILRVKKALGISVFLCDSCKWNWRSTCHHAERPGAVKCPDYEKKGT